MRGRSNPNGSSKNRFQRALALQRAGKIDDAEELYVALLGDLPSALTNLGVIKRQKGQLEDAVRYHNLSLRIAPKLKSGRRNLINALMDLKRYSEVEKVLLETIEVYPDDETFQIRLASFWAQHRDAGKRNEAVEAFQRLLNKNPEDHSIALALADCLIGLDRKNEAIKTLQPHADQSEIRYRLKVLLEESVDRAPIDYVQVHFDRFAPRFEKKLVDELGWNPNDLIEKMLFDVDGLTAPPHFESVLDLGCGTGLAGIKLRPHCESMTGVDLSPEMLALAAKKSIYDELQVADIAAFLAEGDESYDLILALDVFVYIGDLARIFSLVGKRLRPAGRFLFSTEYSETGGFTATPTGRFTHSESYLRQITDEAGMVVEASERVTIRKENETDVAGGLYLMSNPPNAASVPESEKS